MKTSVSLGDIPRTFDPCDDRTVVEVEVPDGWRRVWRGALCGGDKYLDRGLAEVGVTAWCEVDADDVAGRSVHKSAESFSCLIRRGTAGPDKPCERCEHEVAVFGERYCELCRIVVIDRFRVGKP